ncbi:DUF4111 domain-containing protein [Arthrobacter castelli]|uniref:DUF4111 domain-containing protein n=1 Tax=Arthrobacter castelli TaxID=271431 RepID=UPI0009D6ED4D
MDARGGRGHRHHAAEARTGCLAHRRRRLESRVERVANRLTTRGEWLREDLVAGSLPQPATDPDVITLIATALSAHRVLRGPALDEIVPEVPLTMLRSAVMDNVPEILHGLEGDERNTVLTLARSIVTLDTGQIVSKDVAVNVGAPMLAEPDRALLERAKAGYLGLENDDWSDLNPEVTSLAETLASITPSPAHRQHPVRGVGLGTVGIGCGVQSELVHLNLTLLYLDYEQHQDAACLIGNARSALCGWRNHRLASVSPSCHVRRLSCGPWRYWTRKESTG